MIFHLGTMINAHNVLILWLIIFTKYYYRSNLETDVDVKDHSLFHGGGGFGVEKQRSFAGLDSGDESQVFRQFLDETLVLGFDELHH